MASIINISRIKIPSQMLRMPTMRSIVGCKTGSCSCCNSAGPPGAQTEMRWWCYRGNKSVKRAGGSTARKLSFREHHDEGPPAATTAASSMPRRSAAAGQTQPGSAHHPAVLDCPSADFLYSLARHHQQCPSPSGSACSEQTAGPQPQEPAAYKSPICHKVIHNS